MTMHLLYEGVSYHSEPHLSYCVWNVCNDLLFLVCFLFKLCIDVQCALGAI